MTRFSAPIAPLPDSEAPFSHAEALAAAIAAADRRLVWTEDDIARAWMALGSLAAVQCTVAPGRHVLPPGWIGPAQDALGQSRASDFKRPFEAAEDLPWAERVVAELRMLGHDLAQREARP